MSRNRMRRLFPRRGDDTDDWQSTTAEESKKLSKAQRKNQGNGNFIDAEVALVSSLKSVQLSPTKSSFQDHQNKTKSSYQDHQNKTKSSYQDHHDQQYQSNNIYNNSNNTDNSFREPKDDTGGFTYLGLFNEQGLPDDENGIMIWRNGDSYQGKIWNGMRDGMGTMSFADGSEYVGMWECDKMHGDGTRRFANGNVYFGPYYKGKRQGKNGQFHFSNGDSYFGELNDDQFEGLGTYTYSNGTHFEGTFLNSMRQGLGTYNHYNGDTDTSWYDRDKPVGQGVRFSADKDREWTLLNGRAGNQISTVEGFEIISILNERATHRTRSR